MKPPLLVLSLVANAALLAAVTYLLIIPQKHHTSEPPKESASLDLSKADSPSQSHSPGIATVLAPTALTPGTWQSPEDVEAWLRSIGAPLKLRFAVAQALLGKKYGAANAAVRFPPGLKKWQRSIPPSPEQRDKLSALRLEEKQELQRIFGAEYAKANFAENIEEQAGIPPEKLVELNRVTADYMETRTKLMSDRNLTPAAKQLLDDEMKADIRKILTPEEYEIRQAYESQDAQNLQRSMAGLDVDDETYLRIYRAAAGVRTKNQQPGYTRDVGVEEIRAIEKAVGSEIAVHITLNQDPTYREIGTVYTAASLSAADMLEKYALWNQFHQNLPNASPGKLDEAQKAVVRSYYDRLTNGLSATDRADFGRTKTGVFMGRLLGGK